MANIISLDEILNTYGSLNDLRAADGLSGDRRTLTTTDALSAILEKAYTADSLAGKTFFSGIVMATLPTGAPTFTSTRDNLEYLSRIKTQTNTTAPNRNMYFVYKVFVPEIDPRNILEEKSPNCMTLAQRINTLPNAVLAGGADQPETLQVIQPGTLVDITFGNEERFLHPKVVRIGPKLFDINLKMSSAKSKFATGSPSFIPPSANAVLNAPKAIVDNAALYDSENIPNKPNNDRIIASLHPDFAVHVKSFLRQLWNDKQIKMRLNSGYRSAEKQQKLYQQWVDGGKKGVRPASGLSYHNLGMAIDGTPTLPDGTTLMKEAAGRSEAPLYIDSGIVSVGDQNGLYWGGRFQSNYDPIHFDFRNTLPLNRRQAHVDASVKNGVLPTQQEIGRYA